MSAGGVWLGVGESTTKLEKNGCLCGSGEMSMRSSRGPGDEEGIGGVVTFPRQHKYLQVRQYCVLRTSTIHCSHQVRGEQGTSWCGQLRAMTPISDLQTLC